METPGGKLHQVRWNDEAAVTLVGQMAFFIEFLSLAGVMQAGIDSRPLAYHSPNAPSRRDLLGTWLLSIPAGHKRYAHVTSIRGDGGECGAEEPGIASLREHLERCVLPALKGILDVDTPIKDGQQEGRWRGSIRRSLVGLRTLTLPTWSRGLRLVLDAEVRTGNASHSNHTLPGLLRLLDRLALTQRPYLVLGDCGLRLTKGVKRYIERRFFGEPWPDAGAGWQGFVRLAHPKPDWKSSRAALCCF